jgi:hypothetical protein
VTGAQPESFKEFRELTRKLIAVPKQELDKARQKKAKGQNRQKPA